MEVYFVFQQEEASEAEELVMASLEWVKDPDEDMQQAWEGKLVVSNSFSEGFGEMVGLCRNFMWVSCCCMLCVFITGDQSPSVGQRWLHGEKCLLLLGIWGEERMIAVHLLSLLLLACLVQELP